MIFDEIGRFHNGLLYTQKKFGWQVTDYTNYSTYVKLHNKLSYSFNFFPNHLNSSFSLGKISWNLFSGFGMVLACFWASDPELAAGDLPAGTALQRTVPHAKALQRTVLETMAQCWTG